jgi:hypothetical protein
MESTWNKMDSIIPLPFQMESIWNPSGMVMEFKSWFHVDSRWKFHME